MSIRLRILKKTVLRVSGEDYLTHCTLLLSLLTSLALVQSRSDRSPPPFLPWRLWTIQHSVRKREHRLATLCRIQWSRDIFLQRLSAWKANRGPVRPLRRLSSVRLFNRSFGKTDQVFASLAQISHAATQLLLKIPLNARDIPLIHPVHLNLSNWQGKQGFGIFVSHREAFLLIIGFKGKYTEY